MGLSGDIMNKVKKATETATQKVGELTESAKLNMEISAVESDINDLYRELGRAVYFAAKTSDSIFDPAELIGKIDGKTDRLVELKAQQDDRRGLKTCAACGKRTDAENEFCPACGKKLD
ncbi:hypothetical protein H8695_08690 [Clostridiales bacterium BX7]|uniref:Zinc-ribbon domain-containing protein n=2 Tax=Feifania hominis TaxID=2763660 RepID=A0A926DEJ5_9FIRM|nr:hypothetical protein [Feifania hominis]